MYQEQYNDMEYMIEKIKEKFEITDDIQRGNILEKGEKIDVLSIPLIYLDDLDIQFTLKVLSRTKRSFLNRAKITFWIGSTLIEVVNMDCNDLKFNTYDLVDIINQLVTEENMNYIRKLVENYRTIKDRPLFKNINLVSLMDEKFNLEVKLIKNFEV